MLFAALQLIASRCIAILYFPFRIWTGRSNSTDLLPDIERDIRCDPQNDAQQNPTPLKQANANFIKSLSHERIRGLASRHNDNQPCEIFGTDNGSFNVCFFIIFPDDDTRWVVRVPIEPAVQQPWEKVQSEVATIK